MKSSLIIQPVVSEKSFATANELNKYTFWVDMKTSKIEIKKAVEEKYKVTVENVNTVIKPGKSRMDFKSRRLHRKADRKKAIVTVKKGDKIDDFTNI